jgi:hypothetical protein
LRLRNRRPRGDTSLVIVVGFAALASRARRRRRRDELDQP